MNSHRWNAVCILYSRIDVNVIGVAALSRCLNIKADWRWVPPFDLAFELPAESLDLIEVPGKFGAASVRINRIAANKFFLPRIFKILPARHPRNGAGGNIIGKAGLPEQLREITARGCPVQVVAQIPAELPA